MNIFKRVWNFWFPPEPPVEQRAKIEIPDPMPMPHPPRPLPPPPAGFGRRGVIKRSEHTGYTRRKTDQPKKVETPTRVDHQTSRSADFLSGAVVGAVLSSPKRESSYSSSRDDDSSSSSSWSSSSSDSGSSFGGGGGDSGGGGSSGGFD